VKTRQRRLLVLGGTGALLLSGILVMKAQDNGNGGGAAVTQHSDCALFANREKFVPKSQLHLQSALTTQVVSRLGSHAKSRVQSFQSPNTLGMIDQYLFAAMNQAGVTPADLTTDYEFIRRVTLDLTGRIPTPAQVSSFVADTTPTKRANLVDQLLTTPEWVDKWTMYYGDLYQNTYANTFVTRYQAGRNAFYTWIKSALANNMPYNQMASALISNHGPSTYNQGELNWIVGGWVIGNPVQDNFDQQAANVADTFLGISHMNCLLCHDGRGHLDALSVWGASMTRARAWGFASFMSHATTTRVPVPNAVNNQPYYWTVSDDPPGVKDYPLNTTAGNRPPRQPIGTVKNVAPLDPLTGLAPNSGETYRVALARIVTGNPQFARATVNYLWAYFFGIGIVDPPDQFDPARLDPNNPPPAPWTFQPSNPELLEAMTQAFIADNYNIKDLMRNIVNSQAYQLSSEYNGTWNAAWEPLFARKMVRRLWPEEIHDAVAQSSGMMPNNGAGYNLSNFSTFPAGSLFTGNPTYGNIMWAMQSPDVVAAPDNSGPVSAFEDAFFRGDRDLNPRRSDGASLQALDLMNDPFITTRVSLSQAPKTGLLQRYLGQPADQTINNFYLNVLSRYPTDAEMATAMGQFPKGGAAAGVENLLWALYNKVDFVFNY